MDFEVEAVEVFGGGGGGAFFLAGEFREAVEVAVKAFERFHFGAVLFDEGVEGAVVGVCSLAGFITIQVCVVQSILLTLLRHDGQLAGNEGNNSLDNGFNDFRRKEEGSSTCMNHDNAGRRTPHSRCRRLFAQ